MYDLIIINISSHPSTWKKITCLYMSSATFEPKTFEIMLEFSQFWLSTRIWVLRRKVLNISVTPQMKSSTPYHPSGIHAKYLIELQAFSSVKIICYIMLLITTSKPKVNLIFSIRYKVWHKYLLWQMYVDTVFSSMWEGNSACSI